jgi:plastocyanin
MRAFGLLGLGLVAVAACAFAFSARPGGWGQEPREVVLIARDMAFTAPGQATGPNPTLHLKAGERIRLVLENRDPGMKHDLAVTGLGIRMAVLDYGGIDRRVITVPRAPGEYEYLCSFHARLMRGRIVIE